MKKHTENRPWGSFEKFCENKQCTVKIMYLKPNSALSLQYHHHRDEFLKILSGEAVIMIGKMEMEGREGDEFFIPHEVRHRIKTNKTKVGVLEISFGNYSDNDEVRLEDKYKRV